MTRQLDVYYEHPDWFRPLCAALESRGINYVKLNAPRPSFGPAAAGTEFSLLFNRMSASAYLRGNGQAIFFTQSYLAYIETTGVRVLNGSQAFALEISKARQLQLFDSLGLRFPKTRIVNCTDEIPAAAEEIGFPLLVKPNIGSHTAAQPNRRSRENCRCGRYRCRRRRIHHRRARRSRRFLRYQRAVELRGRRTAHRRLRSKCAPGRFSRAATGR